MLKKISYNLDFAFIGSRKTGMDAGKEIFIDYLKNKAIEDNFNEINEISEDHFEYFTVFKEIPIKIKVLLSENLEELLSNKEIQNLDVLVLALNVYDMNALDYYNKELLDKFRNLTEFKGVSALIGINTDQIYGKPINPNYFRMSKANLINKAKELNVIYCFEIQYKYKDLLEFYDKILNDFVYKFQFKSPELFEQAMNYGKELKKQYKYLEE